MTTLANLEGQGGSAGGIVNFTQGGGGSITVPKGKFKLACSLGNTYRSSFTVNGQYLDLLGVDFKYIAGDTYGLYVAAYELNEGDVLVNQTRYVGYQIGFVPADVMFRVAGATDEWV